MRGLMMKEASRSRPPRFAKVIRTGWVVILLVFMTGCHRDMYNQPKYKPLEPSTFFADGRSARQPVPNTIAVSEEIMTGELFTTGMVDGQVVDTFPMDVTREVVERGREQYNINCVPCHGLSGYGNGMVWRRGGVPPANFHTDRLRSAPSGHFFGVITNGYRYMYPYGNKITEEDRWAIIAYIRALQLSQNATPADVPPGELESVQGIEQ